MAKERQPMKFKRAILQYRGMVFQVFTMLCLFLIGIIIYKRFSPYALPGIELRTLHVLLPLGLLVVLLYFPYGWVKLRLKTPGWWRALLTPRYVFVVAVAKLKGLRIKRIKLPQGLSYFILIIFLASLILFALQFAVNWSFLQDYQTFLMVIAIIFGTLALWLNKDKLDLQSEVERETEQEERRAKEARGRFGIPVVGGFLRLMYREGWFYSLSLLVILVLGTIYLVNIALHSWVGTDEGRLLYDASLVLQGKIPMKDFLARAPLLVYATALSQKVFGVSIFTGRVISVISVLISALLIYLFGKEIHSKKTGLLASFIFIFYPWIQSFLSVQTQPLQIVLVLLFLIFLIKGLKRNKRVFLVCAGIFLGLSCLVRESSLIFIFTLPFMLYAICKNIKLVTKELLYTLIPLIIVVGTQSLFFGSLGAGVEGLAVGADPMPASDRIKGFVSSMPYITFFMLFVIPLLLTLIIKGTRRLVKDFFEPDLNMSLNYAVLLYWLGSLILFYAGYAIIQKFHPGYFREFFPIFALITAMATIFYFRVISKARSRTPIILLSLAIFSVVYISFFSGSLFAIRATTPRYTQEAIEEVSYYIKKNTNPEDFIFCGSPIWAYMAERNNAGFYSHPVKDYLQPIEEFFREHEVQYVIIDGKTQQIIAESEFLTERVDADYKLVKKVKKGSYVTIQILEKKTRISE